MARNWEDVEGVVGGCAAGKWLDPDKCVILEDDPSHPNHAAHETRRKISHNMVMAMVSEGVVGHVSFTLMDDPKHEGAGKPKQIVVITAGRRRIRHARVAKATLKLRGDVRGEKFSVKGIFEDKHDPMVVQVIENCHRMEDSAIVKARQARELGKTMAPKDICHLFDVTPQTLTAWEVLLGLCDTVQRGVEMGHVTASAVIGLKGMSPKDQVVAYQTMLESGQTRGQGADEIVTAAKDAAKRGANVGKAVKRAVRDGIMKMLPRGKVAQIKSALPTEYARESALLEFVSGNRDALDAFPPLKAVVMSCFRAPKASREDAGHEQATESDDGATNDQEEAA